jgi:hypothetical protein
MLPERAARLLRLRMVVRVVGVGRGVRRRMRTGGGLGLVGLGLASLGLGLKLRGASLGSLCLLGDFGLSVLLSRSLPLGPGLLLLLAGCGHLRGVSLLGRLPLGARLGLGLAEGGVALGFGLLAGLLLLGRSRGLSGVGLLSGGHLRLLLGVGLA